MTLLTDLKTIVSYPFLLTPLLVGILVSLCAALLGSVLVLPFMAFLEKNEPAENTVGSKIFLILKNKSSFNHRYRGVGRVSLDTRNAVERTGFSLVALGCGDNLAVLCL